MSQATLGSAPYQNSNLFSGYYLDERIYDLDGWDCDEEAQTAFEDLKTLWDLEGGLVDSYKEDELLDEWIDEVLEVLGFGTKSESTLPDSGGYNDRLLFDSPEKRRDAAERVSDGETDADYKLASAVLEAKQWGADFTERFSEARSYRDASHQIKYYLEHTPETLKWGVLTDGKKWRLYGTKDYATEIYYEVDLPELLSTGTLEQFKYFYAFFRPEAFREVGGTSFLDKVWNESETAAQELGEDLQDNVFTALRVLGEGFIHQNDLKIDPGDEDARAELKEQSLVLLYRLMFVLYAESRGLIRPDDEAARDEYEEHFSLDQLRAEIHEAIQEGDTYEDYSGYSTKMWSQLQNLFELVDEGNEDLDIPPYNGGLFDDGEHEFLAENDVADRHIAEVIHRLGTTVDEDDEYVLADYADLDTRHLGSIYEGLLEHEFRIADEQYAAVSEDGGQVWKPATEVSVADAVETVEEGELYVVNDDGERKATGAYYTPDYVVSYIVEETIVPLLDDIKSDLEADGLEPSEPEYFRRFWQRVQDLKILDPAMGSAHFLTSATGYLTEQVMEVVREQEIQGYDEQHLRREIAKECIYGVDINGMAVELGKLSMWLETLAADQPLAFLDHHLKDGNSLVGSDITEVLSDDVDDEGGQLTLMQVAARARKDTLEHVMDLMQELLAIDNETLDDIKSMEELYDEIRDDPLYQRLFEIANVHTAEEFGLDVPEGVYEEMAGAIEDEDEWTEIRGEDWFASAQAIADEEDFFHWELEYPEVFFGEDGEKKKDAGFDAVVSNPPYIKTQNLREELPEVTEYLKSSPKYNTTRGRFDIYAPFVELGVKLTNTSNLSYILPNKFFTRKHGEPLREFLTSTPHLRGILDFGENQVFQGATTYTCILSMAEDREQFSYSRVSNFRQTVRGLREQERIQLELSEYGSDPWVMTGPREMSVLQRMEEMGYTVSDISEEVAEGITSGDNDVLFVEITGETDGGYTKIRSPADDEEYVVDSELIKPLTDGDDINRYEPLETTFGVIYPYQNLGGEVGIIGEEKLISEYHRTYEYLCQFQERLANRGTARTNQEYKTWYSHYRRRDMKVFEEPKLLTPDICGQSEFSMDDEGGIYFRNSAFGFVPIENTPPARDFYLAVLNSSLTWFYIYQTSTVLENDFRRFTKSYLTPLPVPEKEPESDPRADLVGWREKYRSDIDSEGISSPKEPTTYLSFLGRKAFHIQGKRSGLNTSLHDHLGAYTDGQTLADVGLTQPPEGSADSILQQTTEEKPNLRVGEASVERESPNTVEIRLKARYKPDDDDAHETDQWGYTETEPLPALRITDLTETEADLIEAFIPVAVDEAGGFASFRENATKTNSLVDRLRKLTLPDVNDVREGLESYIETKARAEELEEKIEKTDDLIDEIVYELYGLTDEEIEIVEETVAD